MDNPWTILSSTKLYESAWLSLIEHSVVDAAGQKSLYGVVRCKHKGLRTAAIDFEGSIYLVGQYRFGAGYYSWELPAGAGAVAEVPVEGAKRELREEVGLEAASWLPLLDLVHAGSITDAQELNFVAWELSKVERVPDPQEVIRVRRVPFGEALAMALSGEIRDAGSVAAILAVHAKLLRDELPPELSAQLRFAG